VLEKARANGTVVKTNQSVLFTQVSSGNTADSTNSMAMSLAEMVSRNLKFV
jgi:hypothetical protein